MSWDDYIPLFTLLTSLVPAAIIFALPEQCVRTRTAMNLVMATLKLVLIAVMLRSVFYDHRFEFHFPVLPGLDFVLRADALAMFFVTLSGILWFLTTVYAIAYLEGAPHRRRFFGFFSLCVSATVGIALAGNLFTFVLFYELLTLSTYPLVVHRETEASRRAGRVYLLYTLGGGALLLVGAVWLHELVTIVNFDGGASLAALDPEHDGTLRIIFFLLIVGLGVKAALVPLHGWLPQSMVAPAPVSALLHAVAVVKAGAFGIVRVVYDVYGIDRAAALGVMLPLAIWASVTIIYGSVRALYQDDLKRRLAFSTVSQVSYIVLGVALLGPSSTVGGVVHLVHQGLMKITLFFCAGNLAETLGIKKISKMHGVGRRMPWTMTAFTVGALGMIGVPPMCGFVSKWYLGSGAIEAAQHWVLVVLAASSALNAAYFLPVLYVAWFGCEQSDGKDTAKPSKRQEAAWGLLLPPLATATLAVGTGILAATPLSPLQWAVLVVERAYNRAVIDRGLVDATALLSLDNALLLLAVAVPLVMVCLVLLNRLRSVTLWLAAFAALPALGLALGGEPGTSLNLNWLLLRMQLGLDATGQTFLLFTALLWLLAGIYARGYLADDPRVGRFFVYFLLTMTGNIGLVLSQDMASFYMFFALMSFAAYPLVIHHGDAEALRAGRVYIVLVVLGELALVAGMLLATVAQDSLIFGRGMENLASSSLAPLIVGLILVGFGIKAGVVPLHVWLPLAHPAAPTPASAVLSGAMIKAGLLGWLRFLPLGEAAMPAWGHVCLSVGLVTAFYGVAVGVTQRNAKAVLAYSSISQMGLIMLGLGGGFLVPQAWPSILAAILVYSLHHGLSKGCLFLSVGVAPSVAQLPSLGQRLLLKTGLVVPAMALAGAPLMLGASSKSALKYSLADLPQEWNVTLDVLLPLASVGTTLLMARFLYLIWPHSESRSQSAVSHVAPAMFISWLALLIGVLTAAWFLPAGSTVDRGLALLGKTMIWANLWPVAVGSAIAWIAWWLGSRQQSAILPAIPSGDLIAFWRPMQSSVARFLDGVLRRLERPPSPIMGRVSRIFDGENFSQFIHSAESVMQRWPFIAVSLIVVIGTTWSWWFYAS